MWFSRLRPALASRQPKAASAPEGMRIYAIGDVHGRDDLLDELAGAIRADLASAPPETVTVFIGDYLDRGPQSAAVLDRLSAGRFPTRVIALRGNHEEMFLKFLQDSTTLEEWRRYGGLETLHSYGVDVKAVMRGEGYE